MIHPLILHILAARKRLNLSQTEAAQAWEVSVNQLRNWEQGICLPGADVTRRLWLVWFPEDSKLLAAENVSSSSSWRKQVPSEVIGSRFRSSKGSAARATRANLDTPIG